MSSGKAKGKNSSRASYKRKESRHDKWYRLAKEQGYRSRAAFKLIQINKKYNMLSSSKAVIDLCACPGGWLQVCAKYMPVSSLIIGVDRLPMKPIRGVRTLMADITTQQCRSMLKKETMGWQVDGVLHDGSPNVGGATWAADAYQQIELVLHSLKLASEFLRKGGWFVSKLFRSQDYNSILWVLNQFFKKTEVFKPQASRQQSAEIFVVCLDYQAPKKIDPKLFDPAHVFKSIEAPKKIADVMHAKAGKQKRNRSGYDDDAKQVLHKSVPVKEFIEGSQHMEILGSVNALTFDKASEFYAQHPLTTDEIKILVSDFRVLGKSDFNAILKWRKKLKDAHAELMKEQQPEEEKRPARPELTPEEKAELDEKKITNQLEEMKEKLEHSKKKAAQKKHEDKMKAKKRMQLNKNVSTEGEDVEAGAFKLSTIKDAATLEALTRENLDADEDGEIDLQSILERERSDSEFSDADNDEAAAAAEEGPRKRGPKIISLEDSIAARQKEEENDYDDEREQELEGSYAEYKRRRKMIDLRKDKKVGLEKEETTDDIDTRLPEEEDFMGDLPMMEEEDDETKSKNPLEVDFDYDAKLPDPTDTTGRWFGRDLFAGIDGGDLNIKRSKAAASKRAGPADLDFSSSSDSDGDDDEDVSMSAQRGKQGKRQAAATQARKPAKTAAVDSDDDEEEEAAQPASKKLKGRAGTATAVSSSSSSSSTTKAQPKTKTAKPHTSTENSDEDSDDDDPLSKKRKQRKQAVKAAKEEQSFEEVPAEDYSSDSDARAEIVAMGTAMLRKKRRREMEDMAYNRYSFHDDNLPDWFKDDEQMHMVAQLPVSRSEMEEQKAKMKGIDSRPIRKLAEALGRKKKRALLRWEKARAAAESVTKSSESSAEKLRSLEKIMKKASKKQKVERVYLVSKKSGTNYIKGKKGTQVVRVDKRQKKDKRAAKRNEEKKKKKVSIKNKKKAGSKKA